MSLAVLRVPYLNFQIQFYQIFSRKLSKKESFFDPFHEQAIKPRKEKVVTATIACKHGRKYGICGS
jgi:hypothetical protein